MCAGGWSRPQGAHGPSGSRLAHADLAVLIAGGQQRAIGGKGDRALDNRSPQLPRSSRLTFGPRAIQAIQYSHVIGFDDRRPRGLHGENTFQRWNSGVVGLTRLRDALSDLSYWSERVQLLKERRACRIDEIRAAEQQIVTGVVGAPQPWFDRQRAEGGHDHEGSEAVEVRIELQGTSRVLVIGIT